MTTGTERKQSSATKAPMALQLLMDDHKEVNKLFKQFEKSTDNQERASIVQMICQSLTLHAAIEEEIFYPEVRAALQDKDHDLLDEAEVEHQSIKSLVEQLDNADPDDELYEARVVVLKEYVRHHVEEEEGELFPKVKRLDLDLQEMGERLLAAKGEVAES